MSNIEACFASKPPHKTCWIELSFDVDDPPNNLLHELEKAGWSETEKSHRVPPLNGRQEMWLNPPKGSGLFGGWNDDERKKHMSSARRILRKYGLTKVPHWKKTLVDML